MNLLVGKTPRHRVKATVVRGDRVTVMLISSSLLQKSKGGRQTNF
jgi:hypothetical protein